MPIYRTKKENFFKKWSSGMAYVLGFFTADGSMYKTKRNTHFIEFQITDGELLEKIRSLLGSNHKITAYKRNKRWNTLYRLQIGSKVIFNDLRKLGLMQNKSKTMRLPFVPKKYFSDFVRGYFDGDGNVWAGIVHKFDRRRSSKVLFAGFTSGSRRFLAGLMKALKERVGLDGGSLQFQTRAFRLRYSTADSLKLCRYMYYDDRALCLERKKSIFTRFVERCTLNK